jgi:hypothetical protein
MLRRSLVAFGLWLLANAAAGLGFDLVSAGLLGLDSWRFFIQGLFAGVLFGAAQWLVLRPFFVDVRWWVPATVVASPVSWMLGVTFAGLTFGFGGWLGGGVSAAAQTLVLALGAGRDETLMRVSFLWLPASLIGGALFYFGYYSALVLAVGPPSHVALREPTPFQDVLAGSIAYGVVTGLAVAILAAVANRRSARNAASRPAAID